MRGSLPEWIGWLAILVAIEAMIVIGLISARSRALADLGTTEAKLAWREWQAETVSQSQSSGPVRRRAVKVEEPPGLILVRDHFAAIVASTVLVTSAFFGFLLLIVRGMLASRGSARPAYDLENGTSGPSQR